MDARAKLEQVKGGNSPSRTPVLQIMPASVNVRIEARPDIVMRDIPEDRSERHRLAKAIDDAFRAGDVEALKTALGNAPRWFDEPMPHEFGLGHPLEYAIYWSPLGFIEDLIALGSNVNYGDHAGFPSLIATLSTDRHGRGDRLDVLRLLIRHGADLDQRGHNDWTPLHYATNIRDLDALRRFSPPAPTRRCAPASTTSPPRSRKPRRPALPKVQPCCARPWRTAMEPEERHHEPVAPRARTRSIRSEVDSPGRRSRRLKMPRSTAGR